MPDMLRSAIIALAVGMSLQSAAAWSVTYACQMSGRVASTCCCEMEQDGTSYPVIEADCPCCDVSVTEPHEASARSAAVATSSDAPAAMHATALAASEPGARARDVLRGSIEGTAAGPPPSIFLVNQSFRC